MADLEILEIMATKLWQLHVTLPVLKEVKALPVAKAEKIGIVICEPSLQDLTDAASRGGALSSQDRLCLTIAQRRGWSCLTNDQLLRRDCGKVGVPVVWGLEAMVLLHKHGYLPRSRAATTAETIHALNPRHIHEEILKRFLQELDS